MSTAPYTPSEQEEFRPLLEAKLDEARKDLEVLKSALNEEQQEQERTRYEDGDAPMSKAEKESLITRQQAFIVRLEDALKRIDNGVYGWCHTTGQRISRERLRLMPWVTMSIAGKQAMGQ
jgi:RNA polymerase-binding transcription factor DksA